MEQAMQVLLQATRELTDAQKQMTRRMDQLERHRGPGSSGSPKFRTLMDREDIEDYLTQFERLMTFNDIPEEEWVRQLAPMLSGRAAAAYNTIEPGAPYFDLKQAILGRYEVTPNASRVKLRRMQFKLNDDIAEYAAKVDTLVRRWLIPPLHPDMGDDERLEEVERQVRREVAMEHIQRGLPRDVQARIDARGPKDVNELVQCIQEYQLRSEAGPERMTTATSRPKTVGGRSSSPQKAEPKPKIQPEEKKEVTCYKCGRKGHYARDCMARSFGNKLQLSARLIRQGAVNGIRTDRIQVDSGSSLTSVHRKFVTDAQLTGRQVTLRNTEGPHTYPTAVVTIDLDGQSYKREVAVSSQLPEDVLLGTDVPIL